VPAVAHSARDRAAATIQWAFYGALRATIRRHPPAVAQGALRDGIRQPSPLSVDEVLLSKIWTDRFDSPSNA
jgi:hypothetical protein